MNHNDIQSIAESMPKLGLRDSGVVAIRLSCMGIEIQVSEREFLSLYPNSEPYLSNGYRHYRVKVPGANVVAAELVSGGEVAA